MDTIIAFCPFCGKEVQEGKEVFCGNCGKSLQTRREDHLPTVETTFPKSVLPYSQLSVLRSQSSTRAIHSPLPNISQKSLPAPSSFSKRNILLKVVLPIILIIAIVFIGLQVRGALTFTTLKSAQTLTPKLKLTPTTIPTVIPSVTTTPPINWTLQKSGTTTYLLSITWSGSQFVIVGNSGTILTSSTAVNWDTQNAGTTKTLYSVTWAKSQFVAVGEAGTILTSPDGSQWKSQNSLTTNDLYNIIWTGSQLVAVGDAGTILTSPDGINWTHQGTATTNMFL